ncbi:hypothetical protein Bca4012_100664 [Brassica carinata]
MNANNGEERIVHEVAMVVPKRTREEEEEGDCVEVLVTELKKRGMVVDRDVGLADEFLKVAAPLETLESAAAELRIRKPTRLGISTWFLEWIYPLRCKGLRLSFSNLMGHCSAGLNVFVATNTFFMEFVADSLQNKSTGLEYTDELKRKELLRTWALNWWNFTNQPIDKIYSYFGAKYLVLPSFFVIATLWAALFLQFWKRKNAALLASQGYRFLGMEWSSLPFPKELTKNLGNEKFKEKEPYQRYEWFAYRKRFSNDVFVIISIICFQLPFELAYAHTYEMITSNIIKFVLTAVYLLIIQYLTRLGGKVAVKLINREINESVEYRANSLIYKTYIGIFYHVLLHRNFMTLRQVLLQRFIISQVVWTFMDGSLSYLKYSYRKFRARKKKRSEGGPSTGKIQIASRVEKEYLKPTYSASIGVELEDGLFDDSLKLALQFGMVMMFACAFPLAFALATVSNIMDIRTTALKLLVTLQRPSPRAAATIGAWLNIWQFLVVMSICTNSALLVCLYEKEGKWKMEPGLAAILILEHILLLLKFGLSRLVPEEPAWVRANRVKNVTQAQEVYSKQLLRSSSSEFASMVKPEEDNNNKN